MPEVKPEPAIAPPPDWGENTLYARSLAAAIFRTVEDSQREIRRAEEAGLRILADQLKLKCRADIYDHCVLVLRHTQQTIDALTRQIIEGEMLKPSRPIVLEKRHPGLGPKFNEG